MSSESVSQRKSIGKQALSLAAFPVGMSVFSGAKSVIRNHGISNAVASLNKEGFKTLQGRLSGDCFSRGLVLANNYDKYSQLAKEATKLQNLVDKNKIPFKDKIFNIFRKNKVTIETIESRANEAKEALKGKQELLAEGKQIAENAGEALKTGFGKNVGGLIKKGFKDPFVWAFTLLETVPEVINKVIPTFKEKGFAAGMKEAGKTAIKAVADMGTYVASSAVGRVLGTAIGTIFCPGAGSAVGGSIGSMIAVSLGNIVKGKIFKPKEQTQNTAPQQNTNVLNQKTFVA